MENRRTERGGGEEGIAGEREREREGFGEGEFHAWRWSDYEERKGTAGGTTGKKRRRMRKAALLGERRRGRAKMAEREGEEKDQTRYSYTRVMKNIAFILRHRDETNLCSRARGSVHVHKTFIHNSCDCAFNIQRRCNKLHQMAAGTKFKRIKIKSFLSFLCGKNINYYYI